MKKVLIEPRTIEVYDIYVAKIQKRYKYVIME